ncbi:winged helix-turn-helix domain-containing protein [Halobacillus litoralis]|uniref:winged helix-turn-helix domain-containing protein n=1 Tax=Halobacillus litoralis TaxID=45668 RepID=UPI001CD361E1|nr:winged helix-turn-helix domain-containing protein [Halobacillus litoralis]MCA0970948.1 winged helix-turn-helix domain-containing protein [Halobacillus litoralis]
MRPTEYKYLFQKLWKWSKDPILLLDTEGNIIEVNKASELVFGYDNEELIKRTPADLFGDEFTQLFNNNKEWSKLKIGYVTKEGVHALAETSCERVEVDGSTSWVLYAEGQRDLMIQQSLEQMKDPVIIHHQGEILFANDACLKMLDLEKQQLLGENMFAYIHEDDQPLIQKRMKQSDKLEGMEPTRIKVELPSRIIEVFVAPTPVIFQDKPCTQVYMRHVQQPSTNAVLEFDGFRLDIENQTVTKGNEQIMLSSKEFLILLKLARYQGEPVTVQTLFESIWGADDFGDTRTVMVHLSNLRKKIEDDNSNPEIIQTVRGIGYKFEPPQIDSSID